MFRSSCPEPPPPCDAATLSNLHLWLPWLTAEAKIACRARLRSLTDEPPQSPPEALVSPPPAGSTEPPHLAALVAQVWSDIERLRQVELDTSADVTSEANGACSSATG